MTGVSFVVPLHNGAPWIAEVIASIEAQADGRLVEIVVVDDASTDASVAIVQGLRPATPLRLIASSQRGAAAAINTGIRAAQFPVICQVDQDVVLSPGWMCRLLAQLDDPTVAAVQGCFVTAADADLAGRVMGVDLRLRYEAIRAGRTDHVCTGNSAYRAEAFQRAGLFDEKLGYGLDNDMSYRLQAAGYRLLFVKEAESTHHWRAGLVGYARQQYGLGYGRLDLVAKHPTRVRGDVVSPPLMMLHPILTALALASLAGAGGIAAGGGAWRPMALVAVVLLGALAAERVIAAVRAALRFREPAALLFPALHLFRDLAWVGAMMVWVARRLTGRRPRPRDSMFPRPTAVSAGALTPSVPTRMLVLVPAYNEAATLPRVVSEVQSLHADLDVLVIDDGSTDATPSLLREMDVRWLRLPSRMGVGSAIRAGLRYASRMGYDGVVRLDGDGQHSATDIERMVAPLVQQRADVVLGSRYTNETAARGWAARPFKRTLAACLSALTGRSVTDPTSGFCALGPRAVRLLADHHPTGYPEPELHLFVSRYPLRVVEVPIRSLKRLGGRTSLTPWRMLQAAARVGLAMLIVPLRNRQREIDGD